MGKLPRTPRIILDSPSPWPWRSAWIAIVVLGVALAVMSWLWYDGSKALASGPAARALSEARQDVERLSQELAVAERGQQITGQANDALSSEIEQLQREIVTLRSDLDFYQRLLGKGGAQTGLAIHALQLDETTSDRVYRFTLTLSQNLKKAKVVDGLVEFSVEGISQDAPLVLTETQLSLLQGEQRLSYEFKYFQQLDGTFALPRGFEPQRITLRLRPSGRNADTVIRSFDWSELLDSAETGEEHV